MRNVTLILAVLVMSCAPPTPSGEQDARAETQNPSESQSSSALSKDYRYLQSTLESALERTRETVIKPTDPKTAREFWVQRDLEIDAIHQHISTHAFWDVSEKLRTMVITDQAIRHLLHAVQKQQDHFLSKEEAELTKAGIGERIQRVDEFSFFF